MSDHQRYREWSAAYVMAALDPDERAEFEAHLATCDDCRHEVASLAPVPGLLGRVESPDVEHAPVRIADLAAEKVRSDRLRLVRSRRRWRWAAGVAAVVVAALLVGRVVTAPAEPAGTVLAVVSPVATTGQITLEERAWGTAIAIELSGLPSSDRYVAWAVADDGRWEAICTWGPTSTGRTKVSGASSISTNDLASVVVTTSNRNDMLVEAPNDA